MEKDKIKDAEEMKTQKEEVRIIESEIDGRKIKEVVIIDRIGDLRC